MNAFKRMLVTLLVLLPLATGVAFAGTEHGYSRIFIFGASFMDSGNHFALTGETAHPPFELITFASYGVGGHRPTNGHTWVEVLAQEMGLTEWAKPAYRDPAYGNYAFSFGRAREVANPIGKSLSTQVNDWIANDYCTGIPMNDTLFIVDSGYADLLDILTAPDEAAVMAIMGEMTASIGTNIGILYGCGARNLLFAYLMPAEAAPISSQMPMTSEPPPVSLSWIYNFLYLKPYVIDVLPGDMNVYTVDFFTDVTEVLTTPEDFGFTNVTDSCITPYVHKGAFCKKRNEYFWWDQLHPTKTAHALLAEFALEQLSQP
jgi:phospholipase/lecithinase/hemolysin